MAASRRSLIDGLDQVSGAHSPRATSGSPRRRSLSSSSSSLGARRLQRGSASSTTPPRATTSDAVLRSDSAGSRTPSFMSPLAGSGVSTIPMSTLRYSTIGSDTTPKHRDSFCSAVSPVQGRMSEQASRTELSEMSRCGVEAADVGTVNLEADVAVLRRGLEDTRALARETQRQHKHDTRNWRTELEAAVEGLKMKLSALVPRDSFGTEMQELRSANERKLAEVSKEFARRTESLEMSIEAVRTSMIADTSTLNVRRGSTVSVEDGERSFNASASQYSLSQSTAQWELRLVQLEQQTTKLSANLVGLSQPSHADSDTTASLVESVTRRTETADRRAAALEAAHDRLHERYAKLAQDVHGLQDAADGDRDRTIQLQQGIDDLRDRSNAATGANASNIATLDATLEAQRLRLEDESRSRQRALRDLEQQLVAATATAERSFSETRERSSSVAADVVADAEARVEAARKKSSEQLQQLMARLQKVEETAASNEAAGGENVTAVLERLARLEVVTAEEVSKCERLERRVEERFTDVRASAEALVEQRGAEALGSMTSKLEAHSAEAERRAEQLQKELRDLSLGVDAVKDSRRRASTDAGLFDAERQEAKRTIEGMATKLRVCEDLDARFKEFERDLPALKDFNTKLEPRLSCLEPCIKDVKELDLRIRELEPRLRQFENDMDPRLRDLEPRVRDLEPKVRDLEPRLREMDILVKQVDSRNKEVDCRLQEVLALVPRLNHLEPRMNLLEPLCKEMEPRVKALDVLQLQTLVARVADLEPRVKDLEPRLRDIEPRVREMEPRLKELDPRRLLDFEMQWKAIEPRLKEFEPKLMRIHDFEPRLKDLEPRVMHLHQWLSGLEAWRSKADPLLNSLEQTAKTVDIMEPRVRDSVLREMEPRLKDAEARGRELERKSTEQTDILGSLQRNLESQLSQSSVNVRAESSAWRDALRGESVAWREACGEMRCHTDSAREEVQALLLQAREGMNHALAEAKGEAAAEKIRVAQLAESLAEVRQQFRQHADESSGKLSQSVNEIGWRLSRRIDEVDACAVEARAAVDDHHRQVCLLERAWAASRAQADKDRDELLKEAERTVETHRKAVITEAVDAVKAKLEDAAKATERCEEGFRQTNRVIAEFTDMERDFGKKFERWSDQAVENSQVKLQERLQEMMRSGLADISMQVSSLAERHADKAVKLLQTAAQAEVREDVRQLKEDITKVSFEFSSKCEQSVKELKARFEATANETTNSFTSLTSEASRLNALGTQQQGQHEAAEKELKELRRSFEENRVQFCDRIIPSLRDLQTALTEERTSRSEESQQMQKKLQEVDDRSAEHIAMQRRADAACRSFGETLRECEAAVVAADRRLAGLEDDMEERLHELVHSEVIRGVVSHLEQNQRGQLQQLEGKMDKLVRNLHTPAARTSGYTPKALPMNEAAEDRETWRGRFRESLGDSLYIKKALHHGGHPQRAASTGCIHNGHRNPRR